ncbi:MAG: antitoxin MazE family protein [Rhodocyclales bacterium]|nr:antitoxin MazE family protein [Rhodocyclales bacterium]
MPANATAPRMKLYRERLRAAGLRPIQLWVPDTRAPGFVAECRKQSAALAGDKAEAEAASFIEAVGDWKA